jgi:predicted ester cyclase
MATTEDFRAAALRFADALNDRDLATIDDLLADDFVDRSPMPGMTGSKAETLEMFRDMFERFPGIKGKTLDVVASGNMVVVRSRRTGTDTGGFMPGMPPTGRPFTMEGIDISEFGEDGKVVAHSGIADMMGVMGQLGLLPPPPDAG